MQITFNFNNLYEKVSRSLSIIGKRSIDDRGNLLFRDITLGSRERDIANDFFANAFTELCAELNKFITAEVKNTSGFSRTAYISFWTDQTAADFVGQVTADGQLLYKYDSHTLYQASLSFPFSTVSPSTGTIFVCGSDYYGDDASQLSEADVEELSDEQKAAAIPLYAVGTDPSTLSVTRADIYVIYNDSVYKSSRNCSFTSVTPASDTLYYAPDNLEYQWIYGSMQRLAGNTSEGLTLTLTTPANWNNALEFSVTQALSNYCVAYALHSWFTITAPKIAEKYQADAMRQLTALRILIHEKTPPATPVDGLSNEISPLSISTIITPNT